MEILQVWVTAGIGGQEQLVGKRSNRPSYKGPSYVAREGFVGISNGGG